MDRIYKSMEISIIKTLYFNLKYFGFKGLKLPVLISRNVKLKRMGGGVNLEEIKTGIIKIGFSGTEIFDAKYQNAIWENTGTVIFKGKANLRQGTRIFNKANLEFGKNFVITANTSIVCFRKIKFGDDCLISWENLIMDTDFHEIRDLNTGKIINNPKEIIVGDKVWIGCRNTILKGTYIDSESVIAANSFINGNFKGKTNIIIGDKNTILKENIEWES